MDVGIRYGDGRWPDPKSTFLLRDAFFPVCSPALLEGMHPLRGPETESNTLSSMIARWRLKAHSRRGARGCKQQASRRSNYERGLQINDSAAAYQTAINGSGIALGRTTLVALDLATGRLVRPFGDAVDCELAYYLIQS
jgi:LysR family transcriptional regulator, glycine cleavage system transcriptional activator